MGMGKGSGGGRSSKKHYGVGGVEWLIYTSHPHIDIRHGNHPTVAAEAAEAVKSDAAYAHSVCTRVEAARAAAVCCCP